MTVLAWTAPFLALGSVTSLAWSMLAGHEQPVRWAVTRARWAWRCRRHPALPDHETIHAPERS